MKNTIVIIVAAVLAAAIAVQAGDVAPVTILRPREMALRYTGDEPAWVVANLGDEQETFSITLDIYDEDGERVYHHIESGRILDPYQVDTCVWPWWECGEIGQRYDLVVFTELAGDTDNSNDTLVDTVYVHCDDTLRYLWDFANHTSCPVIQSPAYYYTSYQLDNTNGVLVTGARVRIDNPGSGDAVPRLSVWSSLEGCGLPLSMVAAGDGVDDENNWFHADFGGFGQWVSAGDTGNIWAGVTSSSDEASTGFDACGMLHWPGPDHCYSGEGPGRGAYTTDGIDYQWGLPPGDSFTLPVELFAHLGFGAYPLPHMPGLPSYYEFPHDIRVFRCECPDSFYVEAGVAITPEIFVANDGLQAEPSSGVFPAKFFAIDTYGKINGVEGDTLFADTQYVSHIGRLGDDTDDPDTLIIPISPWTPEGACNEWEPFVFYELIYLVRLGAVGPDESDHCPYNDTLRRYATCLLSHDVGVIDLDWPEPPDEEPDIYHEGSKITPVALVENFGYDEEHDIEVRCEVRDLDSGDVELWHSLQNIVFLDWRGNPIDNPCVIEVNFPTYNVLTDNHCIAISAFTMLEDDLCPDNDDRTCYIGCGAVEENKTKPASFNLEIVGSTYSNHRAIQFVVPRETWVKLDVFDVGGRWVASIANDIYESGYHEKTWNGRDAQNRKVAAGIYLIRMQAEGFDAVRKTIILN